MSDPPAYCLHRNFDPSDWIDFETDRHYLLYAMAGSVRLEAEGQRWTLPPARAALMAAGRPIRISVMTRLRSASVLFSAAHYPNPERAISVFDMTPLARELVLECRHWSAEDHPESAYADRIFQTLFDVVDRLAQSPTKCVLPVASSSFVARALTLTEGRAHETPTVKEIAQATHQSERALSRRFQADIGMTWREALRRIRLVRAVEALATTDRTVTQIAMEVGYTSLSGFNAAFREMFDLTPGEFRESFSVRMPRDDEG